MNIYDDLSDAIVNMDEGKAVSIANRIVTEKYNIEDALEIGLAGAMGFVGDLYEKEEYFIPELLMCADAMYAALHILEPHMKKEKIKEKKKIVIGSILGDTHDIGKNIVSLILSSAGYDVHNIGRDVPPEVFVEEAARIDADIIAISALMTTTMAGMGDVVRILEYRGLRGKFKVIIGGRPVSKAFSDKIGADGYSASAAAALRLVKKLLSQSRKDQSTSSNIL